MLKLQVMLQGLHGAEQLGQRGRYAHSTSRLSKYANPPSPLPELPLLPRQGPVSPLHRH